MKTFRLIGMALLAVVMCVNFASCSDDEDENNDGGTVVSGKLLRSMSEDDNNNYLFSYNEKKQLISATLGGDKINVKWSDSDIIVETISTGFKEEPANFIIKNGIITSTVWDKETETLTYDNNKHQTKLVCGLGEMTISASLAIMMEEKQSHALAHIMQIKKISIQPLILML